MEQHNNLFAINPNDKDSIIQATQAFLAAWNKGDAQLVTSFLQMMPLE